MTVKASGSVMRPWGFVMRRNYMARRDDIAARVAGMSDEQQDAFVERFYAAMRSGEQITEYDHETFFLIMLGDTPEQLLLPHTCPTGENDAPGCSRTHR